MAATGEEKSADISYDAILNFIRRHEEPCVTAGDVAAEFGVTNEAANYRLRRLKERERVQDKQVGASAKIWYVVG